MREVVAELERPVLLFSGGKDSIVLLRLAEKAFAPVPLPFPVLHVDTGHNFPEVIEFRDRRTRRRRSRADRRLGPGVDRRRPGARGRPHRLAQPAADPDAARRPGGGPLRRRVRRRAPRRGARPGQGARVLVPRRVRAVGAAGPARRAVGALQRPDPPRRADPRVPDQQLDRARRLELHRAGGARAAVDLLRPRARGGRARRDAARRLPSRRSPRDDETVETLCVRYRTVGRSDRDRRGALRRRGRRGGDRGGQGVGDLRARRDPRRRPRPRRRRWKTASARATSEPWPPRPPPIRASCCGWPPPGRSTTASRR